LQKRQLQFTTNLFKCHAKGPDKGLNKKHNLICFTLFLRCKLILKHFGAYLTASHAVFCNSIVHCVLSGQCCEILASPFDRLKEPEHDICIQGDVIEVKSFLSVLKKVLTGGEEALAGITLSALQPPSAKQAPHTTNISQ
jgi:hypothetical protein